MDEQSSEPRKPSKGILEQTWDFFSSVPVATVLLFVIAGTSIAGTMIEQEGQYSDWRPPAEFYPARYGPVLGNFLLKTGLTRMYTSWWFMTLLFLLGASLVICSLERFVPLWRAVQRPNTAPPTSFIKHLKNGFAYRPERSMPPLTPLVQALKSRRYLVIHDGDRLYADKGRWGRWGPYITHIGLLLILAGAMVRAIPGFYFDQSIWVEDGATVRVPTTDWYVQSEQFILETYADGAPKAYKTEAVVIENGEAVKQYTISMNQPLFHKWVELYQSSYQQEHGRAVVAVSDRVTGKAIGTFEIDLGQPEPSYTVDGYKINVKEYFPDFTMDATGKPSTLSGEAQNPGIKLEVVPEKGQPFTTWYFVLYPDIDFHTSGPIKLTTVETTMRSTTGLRVKKDLGIPFIYLGLLITSAGVFATFYLSHKRLWAMVEAEAVVVGGWTNRNHHSFKTEMAQINRLLDAEANPHTDSPEGEER